MRKLIIMIGPPGSGKSLASNLIVKKRGATKISTGDILRKMAKNNQLSNKVSKQISNGILICDDIVNAIVEQELKLTSGDIILDGYPRNFSQFVNLQKIIDNQFYVYCVFMKIDLSLVLKRINQRLVCSCCGKSHTSNEHCCSDCGSSLTKRPDDANIVNRLNDYLTITEPILINIIKWCNKCFTIEVKHDDNNLQKITAEVEKQLADILRQ